MKVEVAPSRLCRICVGKVDQDVLSPRLASGLFGEETALERLVVVQAVGCIEATDDITLAEIQALLAYYLVFAPADTALAELAGAAGLRSTIEECFERTKGDLGLDHCEARSWHGWHRHMSLVMAAAAFLAKLAADLRRTAWSEPPGSKPNETSPTMTIGA